MVHLPRLVAFDEQGRERAQSDLDEMVVHDRRRKQDRHGRPLGRCVSVGDKEHPVTFTHCGLGGLRDPGAGAGQSLQRVEARVDPDDRELVEGGRVEEEALELEAGRLLGRLDEQRPTGAEQRRERHREALTDVVDRRIRHLREPLPEVAEERSRTPGERGQRRVIAHRRSRLVSVSGGRTHDHRQLLAGVAKENVSCRKALLRRRYRLTDGGLAPPLRQPAAVRLAAREPQLDRRVVLEATLRIDGEHLPRPEPSPASARLRPARRTRRPPTRSTRDRRRRRNEEAAGRCDRARRRRSVRR